MTENAPPLLDCCALDKSFVDGAYTLRIFQDLNLRVEEGESVAVVGRSGSGKTTLLHIIAGLEELSNGQIHFRGSNIADFGRAQRDAYRVSCIGLIFQFHFLLPDFTACENVAMPSLTAGISRTEAMARARSGLQRVNLEERAGHLPAALSGGERQRVAIARALINKPALIIADEPTGNLDGKTADAMIDLLLEQSGQSETALLVATHDPKIARRADTCYELRADGLHRR